MSWQNNDKKYQALWLSYSSISDFLKCPRSYYLKNVYKDPKSNNKIQLMTPQLALGQVVHEVLESLSVTPTSERLNKPLLQMFATAWERVSGKLGGFENASQEKEFRERGENMLKMVINNPGPIGRPAVKINQDLPNFWLDEEAGIILCGKIDWLEYIPEDDSVRIIDFKTSKNAREDPASLQLPIYRLLVENTQKRKVSGAAYWYLEMEKEPTPVELPDLEEAKEKVLKIAKKIKTARSLEVLDCPNGEDGCMYCRPFEKILRGDAEFVGTDKKMRRDTYILHQGRNSLVEDSFIL